MKRIQYFWIFLCAFFLKSLIAFLLPLAGDETYYWIWGQNLQLSYFDHPPAVAWLTRTSELFSFLPKSLALRFPFVLVSSFTVLVWLKVFEMTSGLEDLGENYSSKLSQGMEVLRRSTLWMTALLFLVNPLLGPGGVVATPDVPLIFFWGLSFLTLLKLLRTNSWIWYALFGLSLGLGFSSKYHIVLFVPAALVYLFYAKQFKNISWKLVPFTIITGLIGSAPVLIWNYLNDWQSFRFQLNHGLGHSGFEWHWSLTYLCGQILLLGPVLFFVAVSQTNSKRALSMSWFHWLFFLYSSFKAPVEANWPIAAHAQTISHVRTNSKWLKFHISYFIVLYFVLAFIFQTEWGKQKWNKLPQSAGISTVIEDIKNLRPIYGPSYQISSLFNYVYDLPMQKLPGLGRYDFYDRLAEQNFLHIEKRFYLLKHESTPWPVSINPISKKLLKSFEYMNLELYEVENE